MPEPMPGSTLSIAGRIAGLAAIGALQTYWFLQPIPVAAKVFAAVCVLLSVARPAAGLLVFAGLAPLSTSIATLCGGGVGLGSQLLEQMAVGVAAGVLLRGWSTEGRTRIGAPALFVAVVALTSAVAMLPAATAPIARHLWDGLLLKQVMVHQTALSSPIWAPLFAALVIAECGLLGWAVERLIRRESQLATRLVLVALAGHAGAAMLNILGVIEQAKRSGAALEALPGLFMTVRISMQTDWNAAGSVLLLAGLAGVGLQGHSRLRKVSIAILLAIVGTGVWLSGSRIATAMGMGAVVAMIGWSVVAGGASRRRLIAAGLVVAVLGVGAWFVVYNPAVRNQPLPGSITLRLEMAKAGLQMVQGAPLFGIGIAKFYDASAAYAGEYLTSVGWRPRENAHNNFVQVLAEQGLVGFIALLWWLAAILIHGARGQLATPDPLRRGLLLAIVACIGTWITGHPLLVPEFAFVFWFYCGVLAALTPAPQPASPRWPLTLLVVVVLATVPFRASALRDSADLEHFGLGVSSLWHPDDSQRYREAGSDFALYLPVNGHTVELPYRLAPGAPHPLVMEIRIRGELVDAIPVDDTAWRTAIIAARQGSRRFELVDFAIRSPSAGTEMPGVLMRIGKDIAR